MELLRVRRSPKAVDVAILDQPGVADGIGRPSYTLGPDNA
jgi:hypothetical protein